MSPIQRSRRIRQLNARKDQLASELRAIEAELSPLERDESRSMGYFFGGTLRGRALLAAMDTRDAQGKGVAA